MGGAERTRLALDLRDAARMARHRRPALRRIVFAADVFALDRALRLLARQRLIFEQRAGEQVEFVDLIGQHLARDLLAFFDEAADFGVDPLGGLLGHILRALHDLADDNTTLMIPRPPTPEHLP